jgi:hypothetical protein
MSDISSSYWNNINLKVKNLDPSKIYPPLEDPVVRGRTWERKKLPNPISIDMSSG